ncbi:MAG TPA: hypothetical protein VGC39_07725 [Candidatus Methylacidiphilales bacterium]
MKIASRRAAAFLPAAMTLLILFPAARASDDFFDSVDDHLKFSALNGAVEGRISGLLDLEEYYVQQPSPGLVYENHSFLFNPRLTLNLDLQLGKQFYLFAQARADRGYDPSEESDGQVRADQYALRYTPCADDRVNFQVGKFAGVVGSWSKRDDSWQNPFITPPLPYENLTSILDSAAAPSGSALNSWQNLSKNSRLPIIWDANYTSGASIFGSIGNFDYAAEIKNASISSNPDSWSITSVGFSNPTYSGRLGWRPNEAWNLGVSSSVGTYLIPVAAGTLPPGEGLDDYREITVAQDASFAWHHLQLWAECYETRFQVPTVGNADTLAYYIEAKYKFTPEFFAALRWNQQIYNTVPNGSGGMTVWDSDTARIDAAFTYRFTPHIQAKIQYSFNDQYDGIQATQNFVAAQFTVRF